MRRNDRAVTSPIEYVLTVAIATILVTGLIIAATGHVSDQRERTSEGLMDVVGQQLAGSLETADRLVRMDTGQDPDTLVMTRKLPDQILGNSYTVRIESDEVVVDSPVRDADVTVAYETETTVDHSGSDPLGGGHYEIEYAGGDLVIHDV